MIEQIPIATLVEDMSVYPRHAVDDANVASLVAAIHAGATLPPIVADLKSKRVTDGWHRIRAYRRAIGPEAVVAVDLRDYADEKELFADAVRLNSIHGRKLDRIDQIRIVTLARSMGISDKEIAVVMSIPEERIEVLSVRIATAPSGTDGTVTGTNSVALKRSASHLKGSSMTKEQVDVHKSAPGVSYLLIARQLTDGLAVGLINLEDERMKAQLLDLGRKIVKALGLEPKKGEAQVLPKRTAEIPGSLASIKKRE